MDQDEEQELVEKEAAEATDQKTSSNQQSAQNPSPSEEERALAEQKEKDIETAEDAEKAFQRLKAEGPWAAEVKDKNFGKSTYQPPKPPSRGAIHDRGNPGETTSS